MSEVTGTEEKTPKAPPAKKGRRLVGCALLPLGVAALLVSGIALFAPDEAWVRSKLVEYGAQHQFRITMDDLEISALSRECEIAGLHLVSEDPRRPVTADVDIARIKLPLSTVFGSEFELSRVELVRPRVSIGLTDASSPGIDRDAIIQELEIIEGTMSLSRPNGFSVSLEQVNYQGQDIGIRSLPAFFSGADCTAELVFGSARASFELRASGEAQSFSLRGLPLAGIDGLRKETGGVIFTGGTLDLTVRRESREDPNYAVNTVLRGFAARADPNTGAFRRVIIAGLLAALGDGNFDFTFNISSERIDNAESVADLAGFIFEQLVREFLSR